MPVSDLKENTEAVSERPIAKPRHPVVAWLVAGVVLLTAAAAVFFFVFLPRQKQSEQITQEAKRRTDELPRLNAVRVKSAPASSELVVPGTTLPYAEASIYARSSGYVSKRLVDIGDRVQKGQLLATVDAPDLDRQVAQARSSLAQSEASLVQLQAQEHLTELTWNRWKVLVAKGVFSRQEGDQQEANYRVAQANVHAAQNIIEGNRENLNRLLVLQNFERVTAPFSGVITARNVDVGTLINAGGSGLGQGSTPSSNGDSTAAAVQGNNQGTSGNVSSNVTPSTGGAQGGQMFSIASINWLRVLVSVPESYTSAIHLGQKANLNFQERAGGAIVGTVTRTSGSIDQNTRTLLVEVQVQNRQKLLPGMYVTVGFLDVESKPPLIVPGAAIVVRNGKNTVATVANDGVVHMRNVVLGRDYGEQTEITSGLREGEAVVLDVTDEVVEGSKIQPQFEQSGVTNLGGGGTGGQSKQTQYGSSKLEDSGQKPSGAKPKSDVGTGKNANPQSSKQ